MNDLPREEHLVAFACWRCNCTMLAKTQGEIPKRCPAHGAGLLGPVSWELNPKGLPLGLQSAQELCAERDDTAEVPYSAAAAAVPYTSR